MSHIRRAVFVAALALASVAIFEPRMTPIASGQSATCCALSAPGALLCNYTCTSAPCGTCQNFTCPAPGQVVCTALVTQKCIYENGHFTTMQETPCAYYYCCDPGNCTGACLPTQMICGDSSGTSTNWQIISIGICPFEP